MSISKEQWLEIEEKLTGFYVNQKFQLNDFEITIQKQRYKENRYCLVVFIDGVWKGLWMTPDKDEKYGPVVKQVWRKRTRAIYPPKRKAEIEKNLGKRLARKTFPDLNEVIEMWTPDFNTAKSLVRQFKKIDGLALVEEQASAS